MITRTIHGAIADAAREVLVELWHKQNPDKRIAVGADISITVSWRDVNAIADRAAVLLREKLADVANDEEHGVDEILEWLASRPGPPRTACPGCGRPALDGHITCGLVECGPEARWR